MKEDPHSSIYKHSDNLLVTPLHLNPFPFIYLLTYTSIILLPTTTIIHPPPFRIMLPAFIFLVLIYLYQPLSYYLSHHCILPSTSLYTYLFLSPLETFRLKHPTAGDLSLPVSFYYFINLFISHLFYYHSTITVSKDILLTSLL